MKRMSLLLMVAALAACSDDTPMAPEANGARPQAAIVFDGTSGVSFESASGCQHVAATDDYACAYTALGLDASRTYKLFVVGYWHYGFECVHPKTGKAWKLGTRYGHSGVQSERMVSGAASFSNNGIIDGPAPLPDCSAYRPYTATRVVFGPSPSGWRVVIQDAVDPAGAWAKVGDPG